MKFQISDKIQSLPTYPFAKIDRIVSGLRKQGLDVIDFGVGDPGVVVPALIRQAMHDYVEANPGAGYPPYQGMPEFKQAVAQWFSKRFGVTLDPETEVASSIGSKEAVFNFHHAIVNPGDYVLVPTPGYPPYSRGASFCGANVWFYPVGPDNGWVPDLSAIPGSVLNKTKLMWITQPHAPTGKALSLVQMKELLDFAQKWGIVLASDEAYSELWYNQPPHSMLELGREGVIVFQSLSKRSAMTGYRVGFVTGDPKLVGAYKKIKTNIDSGTPKFVQAAAIAALGDQGHVDQMRLDYREKMEILVGTFAGLGMETRRPDATIFLWQRVPRGMTGVDFAKRLLAPAVAVVVTPGEYLSDSLADGTNQGVDYCRFALVPTIEAVKKAANRIKSVLG